MIVKVCAVPEHPFAVGVTVIVATCAVVPVLMAVKLAMFVLPLAAKPMEVLSLVQLNVVPATVPRSSLRLWLRCYKPPGLPGLQPLVWGVP